MTLVSRFPACAGALLGGVFCPLYFVGLLRLICWWDGPDGALTRFAFGGYPLAENEIVQFVLFSLCVFAGAFQGLLLGTLRRLWMQNAENRARRLGFLWGSAASALWGWRLWVALQPTRFVIGSAPFDPMTVSASVPLLLLSLAIFAVALFKTR